MQGHTDSSRHPFTAKGQGGASCGLGLDDVADVAVRDPGKRFALGSLAGEFSEIASMISAPVDEMCDLCGAPKWPVSEARHHETIMIHGALTCRNRETNIALKMHIYDLK